MYTPRSDHHPVLFVDSYPQATAGQQETLLHLLERCFESSIAPDIMTPSDGPLVTRLRTLGYPVHICDQPSQLGTYGGAVYRYGMMGKLHMAAQGLRYISQLFRFLGEHRYKAVFCNDMRGLLTLGIAARLRGIPVMIWDKLDKPHGIYDALQLPISSVNLVIAEGVTAKYPNWQKRLWARKIQLLRNGIHTARFAAAAQPYRLHKILDLPEDAILCGIVGSITRRKGHDLLLPAFVKARAQVPNLHLVVVGETPSDDQGFANDLRARSDARVHWLGARSDMAQLMGSLDLLLSPSRYEGMGRVNVEAMAAGVAVIGSNDTGIAEVVVDQETGLLVDPENTADFARAIIQLAQSPNIRKRMGAAGRTRAQTLFEADTQLKSALAHLLEIAK